MLNGNIKTHAILIHQNTNTQTVELTSHPVLRVKGGFSLGAGATFSGAEQRKVASIFNGDKQSQPMLIPNNVLLYGPEIICWYAKPCKRSIHFKGFCAEVAYPAHVFVFKEGQFYAYAVKGNKRPTNVTKLYRSPTGNIAHDNSICQGNVRIERDYSISAIPKLEAFFYEATNTHGSGVVIIKSDKSASFATLIEFWKDIADRNVNRFPSKELVSINKSLSDVLHLSCDDEYEDESWH